MRNVMVVGDVHGQFCKLNELINKKRPDIIYACGDFGYWPEISYFNISGIKPKQTKIYFADGNHENHDALTTLRCLHPHAMALKTPIEVAKNVYYCPRGTITYTPDGRKVLWMGGAYSIDKQYRTPGYDWFPQETIKWYEVDRVEEEKIDILISHTCAKENLHEMLRHNSIKALDPSNGCLSKILEWTRPDLWYFGHWHFWKKGYVVETDTYWTTLGCDGQNGWWEWLK
jgi:predicted phosphodiesterase